jgi:hypothetical protein
MKEEIEDMNFTELCECARAQFYSILSDDDFESPDALSKALEAIEHDKGYRCRYQVRAFMVLRGCVRIPQRIFTVADLSEFTGLSKDVVGDCIRRWVKYDFRYVTRLPKRVGLGGACRYKVRKHGIETYIALKHMVGKNFALNRTRHSINGKRTRYIPKKVDGYFFITEVGKAKGITSEDLPQLVI